MTKQQKQTQKIGYIPSTVHSAEDVIQCVLNEAYPDDPEYCKMESAMIDRRYVIKAMYQHTKHATDRIARLETAISKWTGAWRESQAELKAAKKKISELEKHIILISLR